MIMIIIMYVYIYYNIYTRSTGHICFLKKRGVNPSRRNLRDWMSAANSAGMFSQRFYPPVN